MKKNIIIVIVAAVLVSALFMGIGVGPASAEFSADERLGIKVNDKIAPVRDILRTETSEAALSSNIALAQLGNWTLDENGNGQLPADVYGNVMMEFANWKARSVGARTIYAKLCYNRRELRNYADLVGAIGTPESYVETAGDAIGVWHFESGATLRVSIIDGEIASYVISM